MNIRCGSRLFSSWEELGHAILADLPRKRQRVKWWRVHKPSLTHWQDCLQTNFMGKMLKVLPNFSYSRSWVGYVHIHIKLFNRYDLMFTFGHWQGSSW